MKQDSYLVHFTTGKRESIWAFNFEEAMILAQAEQIKQGNKYSVKVIENLLTGEDKWYA